MIIYYCHVAVKNCSRAITACVSGTFFPAVGTLMGITNTIATIPGFLGPQVAAWLTSSAVSYKGLSRMCRTSEHCSVYIII